MIEVRDLYKLRGDKPVLAAVNLRVEAGSVLGIVGPSGSGKTTLLRCMAGLEPFNRGTITFEGIGSLRGGLPSFLHRRQAAALYPSVGMVFQQLHLFPHLTALENLTLAPVTTHGLSSAKAAEKAQQLLERLGLASLAQRPVGALSGGEQQRVAIGRALMANPQVLFLDEPTSALDPHRVKLLLRLLQEFVQQGGTLVVASHAWRFLEALASRFALMEGGRLVDLEARSSTSPSDLSLRKRARRG